MKYSIHGFYQPRAVELGLTNDDLLVLRWFVDFAGTNKMKTILENDGIYYWINYATLLEDLPVLRITKDTLKRKHFDKLTKVNVLKHKHIKKGGSFSYYAYGINYDTLVYLQDNNPTGNLSEGTDNSSEGYDKTNGRGTDNSSEGYGEIVGTKINLLNNTSVNNSSIKDINYKKIIDRLNELADTNFRSTSTNTKDLIKARINEGFTEDDLILVVEKMCYLWNKEPKNNEKDMRPYLRPSTLFKKSNFENYLNMKVQQRKETTKETLNNIDFNDF